MKSLKPFLLVAGLGVAVLAVDTTIRRPTTVPAPATADSLAGVVARLTGTDSALIRKVTWKQSRESYLGLNWISTDAYRYRDSALRGDAPIAAEADLNTWTLTFAKGQMTPLVIKHELAHLMMREAGHPPAIFAKIEAYGGR